MKLFPSNTSSHELLKYYAKLPFIFGEKREENLVTEKYSDLKILSKTIRFVHAINCKH